MPGELWRQLSGIGKEITPGTAVAATRRTYAATLAPALARDDREHPFAVARRDNVLARTQGPHMAGGRFEQPLIADDLLEWLDIAVQPNVSPTTPGGATLSRLWTFKPSNTSPNSATLEYHDGANPGRLVGARVNTLAITGGVDGQNAVRLDFLAIDDVLNFGSLATLADRTPEILEGWQANGVYLDAFGATPGTTNVADFLKSWTVTFNNNAERKFLAKNSLAASGVNMGRMAATAELVVEAANAQALTEYANWDAGTKRLMRLEWLGPANGLETGFRRYVTVDIPGTWGTPVRDQDDQGTRMYRFPLNYIYDPTNAFGLQVRVQTARTALYT